jgi:arylsulfatase A-like enzyme
MKSHPVISRFIAGICAGGSLFASCHADNPARPNFLVILADDLGYSDLGCYGGEIRTPHLDALATRGLRFTRAYNSSRCCPSRASLLTGLYPHQAGIGRFTGNGTRPGYEGRLTDRCVTLAEVLRPAGYSTYACGKWHVNTPGPTERGFDGFYGFVEGYAVDSWNPAAMIRLPDDQPARTYGKGGYYATDAITDHALDFLRIARDRDRPWLLYLAYQAPHFPIQAPCDLSASYLETYRQGWDVIREKRLAKMKRLGIIPRETDLPPRGPIGDPAVALRNGSMTPDGDTPAWDTLEADRRADLAHRMAAYAAMVEMLDRNVGRLVGDLRENGEIDNTLIFFLSDNGACAEWETFGFDLDPADHMKNPPGRGINIGTPDKPNVLHRGADLAGMGGPGSLFSYGSAWANVSNTPLSLYKHFAHEGGIRTPMIVHWPKRVAGAGSILPHVSHIMDIMPTCVELASATYPETRDGKRILPMEGRSLMPAIGGKAPAVRTLVFEHEHHAAIMEGDWKLVGKEVVEGERVKPAPAWSLYDLANDPCERADLSGQEPERAARMLEAFGREARRTMILPAP